MYMLSERYRVLCSGEGTHSSTLFYIPQKDVIVVGNYTIARMIVDYMSLDDKEKKMCMKQAAGYGRKVLEIARFMNQIIRIRRKAAWSRGRSLRS